MQAARNIAIIALLALGVAFVPGGGRVADTLITFITLLFVGSIAVAAVRAHEANKFTIWTMTDQTRAIFYGAIGVLALCIAGADEAFGGGGGPLVIWFVAAGLACFALFRTWMEARS